MPDIPKIDPDRLASLKPADLDGVRQAVSHGLRFNGRKRIHHADSLAADIAAECLVRHLTQSNYVIMQGPPGEGAAPLVPPKGKRE